MEGRWRIFFSWSRQQVEVHIPYYFWIYHWSMYNINGLTVILAMLIYGVCLVLIICTLGLLSVFSARKPILHLILSNKNCVDHSFWQNSQLSSEWVHEGGTNSRIRRFLRMKAPFSFPKMNCFMLPYQMVAYSIGNPVEDRWQGISRRLSRYWSEKSLWEWPWTHPLITLRPHLL